MKPERPKCQRCEWLEQVPPAAHPDDERHFAMAFVREKERTTKLVAALKEAEGGMDLAYTALEAGLFDEALLHIGHHGGKVHTLLRELGEIE